MADPRLIAQGQERRKAVLRVVKDYIGEKGYAPSTREIASAVDISSPNAIRAHLAALAEDGLIKLSPGVARGISLTAKGKRAAT